MSAAPKPQVKTGEGQLALWTAGAGLALSLLLVLWEPAATLQAYAVIAVTLLAPALGALAALGCFQLTGGHWGELARPALLALLGLLPIALLGLVPALFDLAQVFDWAQPVALLPEVVRRKQPYLNAPFFIARTVGFALLWLLLALVYRRRGTAAAPVPALGALTLVLWVPSITFFAFDWIMSLEPTWYSDVLGLIFGAGAVAPALAAVLLMLPELPGRPDSPPVQGRQDLANLLLTAVLMWIFLHFSQFIIIWSSNLPHEIGWYLHRMSPALGLLAALMVVAYFLLPFLGLLAPSRKQRRRPLRRIAACVLVGHLLHSYWLMVPSLPEPGLVTILLPAPLLVLGGLAAAHLARHAAAAVPDDG